MRREEAMKLLHAYVDGELDPAASLELEAELAADPALRAAHERLRAISAEIRGKADYHGAPDSLRARLASSVAKEVSRPARQRHWLRDLLAPAAFAGLGALLFGLAVTFVRPAADERVVQDILASHARATLGQRMIDVASSDQHTVKPWLSARLPFSPPVTDFSGKEWPLAGARVDYIGGQPVAVLVYKRRKHSIEVFVAPESSSLSGRSYSRQGLNLETFARGGMRYWLISDVARDELGELARLLRGS